MGRATRPYDRSFRAKYGTETPYGDGDCFQMALTTATRVRDSSAIHRVLVVHGEPLGTGGNALGLRYPHAWVEWFVGHDGKNDIVFVMDYSNGKEVIIDRDTYYAVGNIIPDDVRRYTVDEATSLALDSGHYGPWERVGN